MDPDENIRRQRSIATAIAELTDLPQDLTDEQTNEVLALAGELAELVLAYMEWRAKGGFAAAAA